MKKWFVLGISIIAAILLTLPSLANVIGYQTVQTSHQQYKKEANNQRELLFQTIIDVANNKEIQQIILKSRLSGEIFPVSDPPVITKNQLTQMYFLGLTLSKFLGKSRMHSIIGKYQFNNQEMQKEISTVIKKDVTLDREVAQLSNSKCECDNEKTAFWDFPILCSILYHIGVLSVLFGFFIASPIFPFLIGSFARITFIICICLGIILNCDWK